MANDQLDYTGELRQIQKHQFPLVCSISGKKWATLTTPKRKYNQER